MTIEERKAGDELLAQLVQCETDVWWALVRGDQNADAAALDDGFLGVYPDGFAVKSDHVDQLAEGPTVRSFELSDWRWLRFGEGHAMVTYRADFLSKTTAHKKRCM